MRRRIGRSWERLVAEAGSGAGGERSEGSRWRESHRTRRSGLIVAVLQNASLVRIHQLKGSVGG